MAPQPIREASVVNVIFGQPWSITRKAVGTEIIHHFNSLMLSADRDMLTSKFPRADFSAESLSRCKCLSYRGPNSTPGKVDTKVPIKEATSRIDNSRAQSFPTQNNDLVGLLRG